MGFWEGFFIGRMNNGGGDSEGSGCGCGCLVAVIILGLIPVGSYIAGFKTFLGIFGIVFFPALWDVLFDVFVGNHGLKALLMIGLMIAIAFILIGLMAILREVCDKLKINQKVQGFFENVVLAYLMLTEMFLAIRLAYHVIRGLIDIL